MNLLVHSIVAGRMEVYKVLGWRVLAQKVSHDTHREIYGTNSQTTHLSTLSGHATSSVNLFDDDSGLDVEGSPYVRDVSGTQDNPASSAATEIGAIRAPARPMHSAPINSGCEGGGPPAPKTGSEKKIPKPRGQAGKDFSIAEKNGPSRFEEKARLLQCPPGESPTCLQTDNSPCLTQICPIREVRGDLTLNAHLPFERSWCDIPAASKATLFAVVSDLLPHNIQACLPPLCRPQDTHPFLSRFENDWATEAIICQYLKNKRKTLYKAGSLEKPKGYEYLKENAAKRDQSKSRKKTATKIYEANKLEHKKAKGVPEAHEAALQEGCGGRR